MRARGLISKARLELLVAEQAASTPPVRLGRLACERGIIDDHILATLLGAQHQLPVVLHLERLQFRNQLLAMIPRAMATQFLILPMKITGRPTQSLVIATPDPTDHALFGALEQITKLKVQPCVAAESELRSMIRLLYGNNVLAVREDSNKCMKLEEKTQEDPSFEGHPWDLSSSLSRIDELISDSIKVARTSTEGA